MNKLKSFFGNICERANVNSTCMHVLYIRLPQIYLVTLHVKCEFDFYFCAWYSSSYPFSQCVCITFYPLFLIPFSIVFSRFYLPFFFFRLLLKCIVAFVAAILSFIVCKHAKMSFCQCKKKNKKQVVFSAFHFLFLHIHSLLNCIFSLFFLIFHSFAKVGDSGIFFPYFQVIFLRLPPSTIQRTRYMFFAHCSIWYTFVYNRIQCNIWKWIAWLHSVIFIYNSSYIYSLVHLYMYNLHSTSKVIFFALFSCTTWKDTVVFLCTVVQYTIPKEQKWEGGLAWYCFIVFDRIWVNPHFQ